MNSHKTIGLWLGFVWLCVCLVRDPGMAEAARQVICLDGAWQLAQGSMDEVPAAFEHSVPVPGLVDMASPAFAEVGVNSEQRQAFWYRRTFRLEGPVAEVAILKIRKAKFGSRVYLNGNLIGDHFFCFTPGLFDVRRNLKGDGQDNELVVRVGAFHDAVPATVQSGHDFEKIRYLPGIYDSVELILTGVPFIENVQTVPEIDRRRVRVLADIRNPGKADRIAVTYRIRELKSGKTVTTGKVLSEQTAKFEKVPFDFRLAIKDCRLWSPEDPFLYELELATAGDSHSVRFGMRSFRFDTESGRAILNGKPYFMRGTNVCIFRFFEDSERKGRPWRKDWVRRLHRKFKHMHWNSIRYCIGFPPEIWYEVADEQGLLIQDEYPIWYGGGKNDWPAAVRSEHLVEEFTEWMQERWNHPCVVIWDAQNESVTEVTGQAIRAVRSLDISNRPWDNGWSPPQHPDDCMETHPYLFYDYQKKDPPAQGPLSASLKTVRIPHNGPFDRPRNREKFSNPIIINEYGWLWLNRDGSTTTLTEKIYTKLLGPSSTVEQRRKLYARYLAAMTEYWRCHRKCAGVLHFCGLAYSRPAEPRGQTSDHFINMETLTYEPHFEKYVRDAFSPVGLMISMWDSRFSGGEKLSVPVYVINDQYHRWQGRVQLSLERDGTVVSKQSEPCKVQALGTSVVTFEQSIPSERGEYTMISEIHTASREVVRSLRDITVTD